MWRLSGLVLAAAVGAAAAGPALLPGEGLALLEPDGAVRVYGDAERERPLGSLAKLVWLQREGAAWEARGVTFRCRGRWRGWACWNREGHGSVDLVQAAQTSCNLAFLAWAGQSLEEEGRASGASAARAALEADFGPFLGGRLPPAEALPELTPAWIGDGVLLQTSPAAFLGWLAAPGRTALRAQCARLLPDRHGWWVKTGTAPVPGAPGATCAWVAGSDGARCAVLRLPRGRGKGEGLARFRTLVEGAGP